MASVAPGPEIVVFAGVRDVVEEGSVGSVVQGVAVESAGGVAEGGDPERNMCDADEEAHRHGSVAAQKNKCDALRSSLRILFLVLCPIFGVLSCTAWEGTTAGTVVLTIAIILYFFCVCTTLWIWMDLETEVLSPSELDAFLAQR